MVVLLHAVRPLHTTFDIKYFFMKKIYMKPKTEVTFAEVISMMAESLTINSDVSIDGGDALTKKSNWDIWAEEDE